MSRATRLARLLDLRRRQEETSRQHLAQSLRHAAEISSEVRVRTEALEAAIGGQPSPRRLRHLDTVAAIAEPAIFAARAAELSARGAAEELRRDWQRAARRLKGLERLEENRAAEEREASERQNRVELDDLITSRHRKDTR